MVLVVHRINFALGVVPQDDMVIQQDRKIINVMGRVGQVHFLQVDRQTVPCVQSVDFLKTLS